MEGNKENTKILKISRKSDDKGCLAYVLQGKKRQNNLQKKFNMHELLGM